MKDRQKGSGGGIVHPGTARLEIVLEIRGRGVSYLCDICGMVEQNMGLPQGSVLGPLLWNVMYDGMRDLALKVWDKDRESDREDGEGS